MKLFLTLLTIVFLNQNVFATGDTSENPYASAPSSKNESGSTFTAAVAKEGQPTYCEKCEQNKKAMLSNSVGVLNSAGLSSEPTSSGKPVKSGK